MAKHKGTLRQMPTRVPKQLGPNLRPGNNVKKGEVQYGPQLNKRMSSGAKKNFGPFKK